MVADGSARGCLLVPPALREFPTPPPTGFSAVHLDFFALAVGVLIYLHCLIPDINMTYDWNA